MFYLLKQLYPYKLFVYNRYWDHTKRYHTTGTCWQEEPRVYAKQVPNGYPETFQKLAVIDSWKVANNSKIVRMF